MKKIIKQVKTVKDCKKLQNISYPFILNMINYNGDIIPELFAGNENLQFVICNGKQKIVGNRAFANCTSLVRFDSVSEVIGKQSFAFCKDLKDFNFLKVNSLSESSFEFSGLESISLSDKIERIPKACFRGCLKLKQLYLNNVESIEDDAFTSCSIQILDLTRSIKFIGKNSFEADIKLSDIICEPLNPPKIYSSTFYGSSLKNIWFFNEEQMKNYSKNKNWSKYQNLFKLGNSEIIKNRIIEIAEENKKNATIFL